MSLVKENLENDLTSTFKEMTNGKDEFFAQRVSLDVANYVQSATVKTTDKGLISLGMYTGVANGTIKVQASICEKIILDACTKMKTMPKDGDVFFAKELANAIDKMVTNGIIETKVTGSYVDTSGNAKVLSGSAKGTFTGEALLLEKYFLQTFEKMLSMSEKGDSFFAKQMSVCITEYLKSGTVNTKGESSLQGSLGMGTME